MYYESTIFRILFGTGIFGLLFVIYAIRKIPLHILILFLISGLSLDLLLSFKIFLSKMLLWLYIQKKVENDFRIDASNVKSDGGVVHLFELVNNFSFDNSKIKK